ncbi:MAG: GreA/GreB family elongation factor [Phycisphaerales bacterium]
MTEMKVQEIVMTAIAAAQIEPWKYYHVCWWEGRLQCLHVHHTKDIHPVFYGAPGDVFAEGLTVHQWKLTTDRIMDFCRTRGITLRMASTGRKGRPARGTVQGKLQITEFDSLRLRTLIASAKSPGSPANALLDKLQRLIESAHTVAPQDIPGDVVTMNSQVRLKDDDKDNEITLSLVFPLDAVKDMEFERMRVSVLSPIGLSILGRRAGDTLEGRIRVERVLYQPEAAGDYHL